MGGGLGSGVAKLQQNLREGKIIRWEPHPCTFFDAYMAARDARPDLLQAYRAALEETGVCACVRVFVCVCVGL